LETQNIEKDDNKYTLTKNIFKNKRFHDG